MILSLVAVCAGLDCLFSLFHYSPTKLYQKKKIFKKAPSLSYQVMPLNTMPYARMNHRSAYQLEKVVKGKHVNKESQETHFNS